MCLFGLVVCLCGNVLICVCSRGGVCVILCVCVSGCVHVRLLACARVIVCVRTCLLVVKRLTCHVVCSYLRVQFYVCVCCCVCLCVGHFGCMSFFCLRVLICLFVYSLAC